MPALPDSGDDDAALAARARADPAAFAALYARYVDAVYGYCYRNLGGREAAEDATAQIFAAALAALPRYREGGSFTAWLFAIARNAVVDAHRRRRPDVPLADAVDRPSSDPGPEDEAVAGEARASVRSLVEGLPLAQRQVLELRLAGLTGHEIAAAMGRSHLAVKMLQFRAIARIRERLGVAPDQRAQEFADEIA